jgi:hypothetical protein
MSMPGAREGLPPARLRLALAISLTGALVGLTAMLLWPEPRAPVRSSGLAPPPSSALAVGRPAALHAGPQASVWSTVRHPASARVAPSSHARVVTRLGTHTPEGTDNTVLVLGRMRDAAGGSWVHVRLAMLPNGTTGWLPRHAIGGYHRVHSRLVVDLDRLRATLWRDGRVVLDAPVGVGRARWPTPRGRFYIRNRLARYRSDFYGPLAFGTSARSAVLTDWPGGGFVGIHGTDRPNLIPGRISHGCIRMRNPDILRLGRLMSIGTPLEIV